LNCLLRFPKQAKCVEVGTRYGDFAKEIKDKRPDLILSVIDSWQGKFAEAEMIAKAKLEGYALVVKGFSVSASRQFADGSLDLVYIDAAHDYASVRADTDAWWSKVKGGGVLSGHDYENKPDDGFWGPIEVKAAVDDWAKANNIIVHSMEVNAPSWWVVKA